MAHYTASLEIARPASELFSFFTRPANLLRLAAPEMNLSLLAAPEVIEHGSRLSWQGKRWGVSQKIIQEVTLFLLDQQIVIEQKQGPFGHWIHGHTFEATDAGTRIAESIDFSPPSGMLGYLLTADKIRADLEKLNVFRMNKLREIFP
ncbi:MAG: hypothetical protein EXS16_09700 [Gemmataceae bacterium]|nr:hypothetical protein [Gemmataceae bacterium]